jgi:hypothetical protein
LTKQSKYVIILFGYLKKTAPAPEAHPSIGRPREPPIKRGLGEPGCREDILPNLKANRVPARFEEGTKMKVLFLNLGHSATPHVSPEGVEVHRVDCPVPNLRDPSDAVEIAEVALALVRGQAAQLRSALQNGERIVVALPGASGVAAAVVAVLTGLLGFMPAVLVATRTEAGFVYDLGRSLDLSGVREAARALRTELGF